MTFFRKSGSNMGPWTNIYLPKVVFLRYIFLTSYCASQTRIVCQSYNPGKLMYQFTRNGAHSLAFHLIVLDFWIFRVFHYFSTINRPSSLIVTQFRGMQPPHLFLEISYHCPSQFISISVCKHISVFYSNEMKYYFYCISICMVITVICCVHV